MTINNETPTIDLSVSEALHLKSTFTLSGIDAVEGVRPLADAIGDLDERDESDIIKIPGLHASVARSLISLALHQELRYVEGLLSNDRIDDATTRLDSQFGTNGLISLFRKVITASKDQTQ